MQRTRLGLHLVVCALLLVGSASASKAPDAGAGERSSRVVGTAESLNLIPDLHQSERRGAVRRWSEIFHRQDASFLRARIADLNLHPGDVLVVKAGSGREIERLTGRGPKERGTFWTLTAFEESLVLELYFKAPYTRQPPFRVDHLMVGDPGLFSGYQGSPESPESICAPEDFDDVICYQSDPGKWANVMASVGVMAVGANPATGIFCSGSNVSAQNYLLTNQHCILDQSGCDDAEFVFKFYRQSCGGGATTPDYQGFRCDEVVASLPYISCEAGINDLDFTLSSVLGDPAATFGHVQPDPTPLTDGEAIYMVQHPDGRPHEITHGSGADVDVDTTGTLRTIRYYDTLDTEGGSSGSPIFRESDDKLVGLHHCGGCESAGVGNRGMLMSAIYPLIDDYLCSTTLALASAGIEALEELSGNGDEKLDPGETWQFTPKVLNQSCSAAATGVSATFAVGGGSAAGVTLLDTAASFGSIAAGAVASAASPVRFSLAESFSCGGTIEIDLDEASASEGGPFGPFVAIVSTSAGESVFLTVLSDSFDGAFPGPWTIVDGGSGGGAAATWTVANPGGRSVGLLAPFAIVDSDAAGSGSTQDEQLVSPVLDLSGQSAVELRFAHNFRYYAQGLAEKADVDVRSSATGGAWTNVARYDSADATGSVVLDISAQAAGQSDVELRFHYHTAQFEWWWAIDDISVGADLGQVCHPWDSDQIFVDDFETGSAARWDLVIP